MLNLFGYIIISSLIIMEIMRIGYSMWSIDQIADNIKCHNKRCKIRYIIVK